MSASVPSELFAGLFDDASALVGATLEETLGLAGIVLLGPAVRTVLAGAQGPALIAVLKASGTAELTYALGLSVGLLLS